MIVVKTEYHTIIEVAPKAAHSYNRYRVWERCLIIGMKEEVKHPSAKREILEQYGL